MALLFQGRGEALSDEERNDLAAIDALRETAVLELREQGNACVKKGKSGYKDAVDCYTRAIEQRIDDPLQNSVLFANRAHVNLLLGNYRRALNDAEQAIELNPTNVKAYFRGSKAALELDLLERASQLCTKALDVEPHNLELRNLKDQAETRLKRSNERKIHVKEAEDFVTCLEQRHVKLGSHLYKELCGAKKPWLDTSNVLHWPVLLLYGEVMSSDLIEDFMEFDKFKPHLQRMFGDASLPWDEKHEYTRDRIELYYQANAVAPLSRKAALRSMLDHTDDFDQDETKETDLRKYWVKVDENCTLQTVLAKPDCTVPGIPVFYVVALGSRFRELFLSGAWSPP
ncbi:tetratricopeptide repeat protein 4 homolog [Selaginella moellendorffii]|uniref:tetratricopeptide repeat protein 4 homolog n=1 Tax=Selaginella moellendorffii TaxID=88036 RepID=UPI000D1CFE81|nr:tetratricopeptide repeat protein 4 homolog [Selaginella moellendorffii]|eukprot:XP_024540503.1 tetratricopeptide repeat protein 4 homolog [Selaginella moellendorffii]